MDDEGLKRLRRLLPICHSELVSTPRQTQSCNCSLIWRHGAKIFRGNSVGVKIATPKYFGALGGYCLGVLFKGHCDSEIFSWWVGWVDPALILQRITRPKIFRGHGWKLDACRLHILVSVSVL